jgi:hypothetical protein
MGSFCCGVQVCVGRNTDESALQPGCLMCSNPLLCV